MATRAETLASLTGSEKEKMFGDIAQENLEQYLSVKRAIDLITQDKVMYDKLVAVDQEAVAKKVSEETLV